MKLLTSLLLVIAPFSILAQAFSKDRVYGGLTHVYTLNGFSRSEEVYYFRTDGTFVDDLSAENWQDKINGTYRLLGQSIILKYNYEEQLIDTLDFDDEMSDVLWSGGTQLIEMLIPNKLPIGYYEYSNASSFGGMGTGTVYVGSQFFESLFILDDTRFTRDISSGVVISGSNVGGGVSNDDQTQGTYTIKDGLLTLKYDNGKLEKTSLFYSKEMLSNPNEVFMVAFDGSISFYKTMEKYLEEQQESDTEYKSDNHRSDRQNSSTIEISTQDLLYKMKEKHGGNKIDQLHTLKANLTVYDMPAKLYLDLDRQWYRLAIDNPSMTLIEQYKDGEAWRYKNGKTKNLPANRVQEIKRIFYSGIFTLQEKHLSQAKILGQKNSDDLELVLLDLYGDQIGFLIDNDTHLMTANIAINRGVKELTFNSDYKSINGILLPMTETLEVENTQTIETKYSDIEINTKIDDSIWLKP